MSFQTSYPQPTPGDPLAQRNAEGAFEVLNREINVAREAIAVAEQQLGNLVSRLGIQSDYGQMRATDAEVPPSSGQIESTMRTILEVQSIARNVRGLAETLEYKL